MNDLAPFPASPKTGQRPRVRMVLPWWPRLLAHLALLAVALFYVWRWQSGSSSEWTRPESSRRASSKVAALATPQAAEAEVPAPHLIQPDPRTMGSALAVDLNAPGSTGQHDVQVLLSLVRLYSRHLHGRQGLPIGNDSDLERVLTGRNPMRVVILPPSNPAVSSDGRLRDRWGTPYFVHPLGHNQFDIRSAGPDRKMFTDDDLVADPAWHEEDLADE